MRRDSALMQVLRFVQAHYKCCGFLDKVVQPFLAHNRDIALLCILAPPRSGSTLTYQVLSSAYCSYTLRNISNFLYATPVIGHLATKRICKNYESNFSSERGFVSGLCGEAEGLKFWQYWLRQGLEECPELLDVDRLRDLKNALDKTGESLMITGYLGHVFAISALRKVFPRVLFIHLHRDLLSNAYSLLKLTSGLVPFSMCPSSVKAKNYDSKYHLVVNQVRAIHEIITAEDDEDMLQVSYEDLCDDTPGTLSKIETKALKLGLPLARKGHVPNSFSKKVISPDHDADAAQLNKVINKDSGGNTKLAD